MYKKFFISKLFLSRHVHLLVLFFIIFISSCHTTKQSTEKSKHIAENKIKKFEQALSISTSINLNDIFNNDANITFFIYKNNKLIFWSDNAISFNNLDIIPFSHWQKLHLDNAECWCKWTSIHPYSILSLIPIKWHSLCEDAYTQNSFSYRPIIDNNQHRKKNKLFHLLLYAHWIMLIVLIFSAILMLIRHHGYKNININTRFIYISIFLFFVSMFIILYKSLSLSEKSYLQNINNTLEKNTRYIQYTLQNLYPWLITLSSDQQYGMNVDLQDLAQLYKTDINVYDLNGNIIASSTPHLFSCGFLSPFIHPNVLNNNSAIFMEKEQIFGRQCLVSHANFFNASYAHIGYITLPQFVSNNDIYEQTFNYLSNILPTFFILAWVTFIIFFVLIKFHVNRVKYVTSAMQNFHVGQNITKLGHTSSDEFGNLITAYNKILDALKITNDRLLQSEREGAWRTMARQIAHEIKNPLTPMKLIIQQLQRLKNGQQSENQFNIYFDKATSMLIEQIDNLAHIASSFSNFAKIPTIHIDEVDIAKKLSSSIRLFANNEMNIPIRYVGPDNGIYAIADKKLIGQVFNNIIKNAIQATTNTPHGDIIVMLKTQPETTDITQMQQIQNVNDYIEITFSDNGPGISETDKEKIFTPNFTTKTNGTGLGLAISKNILVSCGGKITFSTSTRGTTFFVYLLRRH